MLKDTFGVPPASSLAGEQRVTYHTTGDEASRLYVKKTIVVGNVSKYVTVPGGLTAPTTVCHSLVPVLVL